MSDYLNGRRQKCRQTATHPLLLKQMPDKLRPCGMPESGLVELARQVVRWFRDRQPAPHLELVSGQHPSLIVRETNKIQLVVALVMQNATNFGATGFRVAVIGSCFRIKRFATQAVSRDLFTNRFRINRRAKILNRCQKVVRNRRSFILALAGTLRRMTPAHVLSTPA